MGGKKATPYGLHSIHSCKSNPQRKSPIEPPPLEGNSCFKFGVSRHGCQNQNFALLLMVQHLHN